MLIFSPFLNSYANSGASEATRDWTTIDPDKVVATMTKQEMKDAVVEISLQIAQLKQDLAEAEETGDGRLSVKIRNGALSITAVSLLIAAGIAVKEAVLSSSQPLRTVNLRMIDICFAVAGIGAAGLYFSIGASAVVALTESQIEKINERISDLEANLGKISSRLNVEK